MIGDANGQTNGGVLPRARARSRRSRAMGALLVALVLTVPAATALLSVVPNESTTPFAVEQPNWIPTPVELSYQDYPNRAGTHDARVELRIDRVERLLAHRRIRILHGTYLTHPTLVEARVRVLGTQCEFVTPPGARFVNNGLLTFVANDACKSAGTSASGQLDLSIRFDGPGRIAVWGWAPTTPLVSESPIWVRRTPGGPVLRGEYVDEVPGPSVRRVTLVAFVWQLGGAAWIAAVLIACGVLAALAVILLSSSFDGFATQSSDALRSAAANGCFAAALGMAYALIIPPFQAADESNHFMAFAELAGATKTADEAADWAALTHFRRIRFHPDQQFRPVHMRTAGVRWEVDDATIPDAVMRGAGVGGLWRLVAWTSNRWSTPAKFLALRLTNVLLFVISIVVSTWFVVRCAPGSSSALIVTTSFLVPTLPFFAMHVSNHAPLVSLYVLIAAATLVIFVGHDRARFAGIMLGAAYSTAIVVSRSAIPLAPFIAAVLIARAIVGSATNEWRQGIRNATWFWAGLAAASIPILTNTGALARVVGSLTAGRLVAAILGGAALGAIAELAGYGARRRSWRAFDRLAAIAAAVTAAIVALMLAGSLGGDYPILRSVSHWDPPPDVYAQRALAVALTPFRLRNHDSLLAASFWTGFGWIETRPPDTLITILIVATGASLIALLLTLARRRETRRILALAALLAGFIGSIVAYAVAVVGVATFVDLHGRYVFGLYLSVLLVAWSPWAAPNGPRGARWRALALFGACAAVHGYCLWFILLRYF